MVLVKADFHKTHNTILVQLGCKNQAEAAALATSFEYDGDITRKFCAGRGMLIFTLRGKGNSLVEVVDRLESMKPWMQDGEWDKIVGVVEKAWIALKAVLDCVGQPSSEMLDSNKASGEAMAMALQPFVTANSTTAELFADAILAPWGKTMDDFFKVNDQVLRLRDRKRKRSRVCKNAASSPDGVSEPEQTSLAMPDDSIPAFALEALLTATAVASAVADPGARADALAALCCTGDTGVRLLHRLRDVKEGGVAEAMLLADGATADAVAKWQQKGEGQRLCAWFDAALGNDDMSIRTLILPLRFLAEGGRLTFGSAAKAIEAAWRPDAAPAEDAYGLLWRHCLGPRAA